MAYARQKKQRRGQKNKRSFTRVRTDFFQKLLLEKVLLIILTERTRYRTKKAESIRTRLQKSEWSDLIFGVGDIHKARKIAVYHKQTAVLVRLLVIFFPEFYRLGANQLPLHKFVHETSLV